MQGIIKRDSLSMTHPSTLSLDYNDPDFFHDLFRNRKRGRSYKNRNRNKQRKLAEQYYASIFKRKFPGNLMPK